jgi:NAD(P)H-hydrate epimerase
LGSAIEPSQTVTMAFLKVGLAVAPGYARAGTVSVAEIGIPRSLAKDVRLGLLEEEDARAMLRPISVLAHKGSRGHVLLFAGSPGKRGAARLCAMAAFRSGAGLVTVSGEGVEEDHGMPDPVMTKNVSFAPTDLGDGVRTQLAGKAALGIGPGMDSGPGGKALLQCVLADASCPVVLDADALNHLGTDLSPVAARNAPSVLTPHPGEAARLLGSTVAEVERDRVAAVRRLADLARAVVVLKGARSLVADFETGLVTINPTGTPALATAGSGDVLTGCVAACLASGSSAAAAARLAVYVHGRAGERAEAQFGVRSVTATDLCQALAAAFQSIERDT